VWLCARVEVAVHVHRGLCVRVDGVVIGVGSTTEKGIAVAGGVGG